MEVELHNSSLNWLSKLSSGGAVHDNDLDFEVWRGELIDEESN